MDAFPRLHPRPATGWVNDPNGLGRWDGRWHVMMQWNPHAPRWGDIHWAHLSSPDLVTWTEHAAALTPRAGTIDAGGCWSGVAVTDDAGPPLLVYSATPAGPAEVGVAIATARDDGTWTQPDAMTLPHPADTRIKDVRDPFLFTWRGRRYALQGSRIDDRGAVLLWDADDLDAWIPLGTLLRADDVPGHLPHPGDVWECPQLVEIGGRWVLVVSWMLLDHSARGTLAFTGDLADEGGAPAFALTAAAPFDGGPDFYAPQLLAADGRVIAVGWSDEARPQAAVDAAGWAGTVTFPRDVVVDDAGLARMRPVPELRALAGEPVDAAGGIARPAWTAAVEGPWSLAIAREGGDASAREACAGEDDAEVWVDGSIVEVFDREGSRTYRAYPAAGARWALTAASARVHALELP
ncbi:glycoside hydrolase family 32 protein [Demequina rhizosphaerae]|uniref:glycoside hydrolase family 32 protein n=1 Tax=Demequina rhizosphaerae TaxID=1638985 RepID=UPI000785B42B|nr:glycoside hydrolase family 32 protein [Demequina rhizosphaerae]